MKNNILRKVAGVGVLAIAIGGAAVLAPSQAQAAVIGGASFSPATGTATTPQNLISEGPCVDPAATRVRAKAFGFGFPASGVNVYGITVNQLSTTAPMTLPVANIWQVFGEQNSTYLDGTYDIRIQCTNNVGTTVYDEYQTSITWTTPGNSVANLPSATYTTPLTQVATTTGLAVTPTSPQNEGTAIDLTATVAPAAATGTVEFFDGATSLGTSTLAAGVATKTGVVLTDGNHSLTAVYAGAVVGSNNYQTSTSTAVPFVIDNVVLAPSTTIAVNGSGAQYAPVTIDATVVPNNAVGQVQFFDGATQVGSKPLVNGTASLTIPSPDLGAHSYTAKFVPTSTGDFDESTSTASSYDVAASEGVVENITTEIPAGALTISVIGDGSVLLPAALAADGSHFAASGAMDPVSVVDTRAGAFGWTANGQLGDFFQGGSASIAAENLGWEPSVVDTSNALQVVTAGALVAPADAVTIAAGSNEGLAAERVLASSNAGESVGSAELGAVLTLKAPTTTAVGTHTAVLTLTAI